jgi:superfamily I DNA/RNA helicase
MQLILAGPGSGKTRVITEKILHLIDAGIPPFQVLALTLSENVEVAMLDRIKQQRPYLNLKIHTLSNKVVTLPCLPHLSFHTLPKPTTDTTNRYHPHLTEK